MSHELEVDTVLDPRRHGVQTTAASLHSGKFIEIENII